MSLNRRCFEGVERRRWQLMASGARVVAPGRRTNNWSELVDAGGYASRTGGIQSVREVNLNTRNWYYRFVDTNAYRTRVGVDGVNEAVFGGWWIEYEVFRMILQFAKEHGDMLYDAAAYFLALPDEWGDRGRLVRAFLEKPLRAWRGHGKPGTSPSGKWIPPSTWMASTSCSFPASRRFARRHLHP